jgi:hypothetical protein
MQQEVDQLMIETHIRTLATRRNLKLTTHAHQEMVAENIATAELLSSLGCCSILENYPDHKRGACCLVCGQADSGRYIHVVCTTDGARIGYYHHSMSQNPPNGEPLSREECGHDNVT